jgi:hypothetical protein
MRPHYKKYGFLPRRVPLWRDTWRGSKYCDTGLYCDTTRYNAAAFFAMSALQWKIDHFSAPSFSTLPLSYVDPDGKADGRSILSLSLSLGEANTSATTNDRVFRTVEGATSRDQTAQKRHYQINVRGLEAYRVWTEADRSAIRTALAMPYDVDFGRKDQPQNARLLEQCLPALTTRTADAQCASS